MKKLTFIIPIIAAVSTIMLLSCNEGKAKETEKKDIVPDQVALIKRGEYLVTAVGCDDCHSPKVFTPNGIELVPDRRFSGHPSGEAAGKADKNALKEGWLLFSAGLTSAAGPWGISYAANISSDSTGIGLWTEEQFFRALREGKSKGLAGNRDLLPPMPWFAYKNFSDEDLRAMFAYLKSTKPVKNIVPQPVSPDKMK